MQPEAAIPKDLEAESPESTNQVSQSKDEGTARPGSSGKGASQNGASSGQFPPPKTDKPRPHVCGTCGRSFARLEHLKRHERSHTKEKPFECQECTRCFARRDLLLRHQQKLHAIGSTSSRPRSGRRESVSSAVSGGRVRKNSIASGTLNGLNPMHPSARRNTISHLDLSSLGVGQFNSSLSRLNALGITAPPPEMGGLPGPMNFDYRGMSTAVGNHSVHGGLPRLNTQSINNMDAGNALRTAPPRGSFGGFDIDQLFSQGTTVNPAQLHFGGSNPAPQPNFPALEPFTAHASLDPQVQSDDFGWMRNWNMQMPNEHHENAIDDSSPSRMSSGDSPGDFADSINNSNVNSGVPNNFQWPQQDAHMPPLQQVSSAGPFALESLGSGLPNVEPPLGTISPNTLHDPTPTAEAYFPPDFLHQQQQQQQQLHLQMQIQQDMKSHQPQNLFASPMSNFSSDSPSMTASSMTGSARQSSVTSMSTDSITDATRHALLTSLAQPTAFGMNHRKYSQPSISSPLSSGTARGSVQGNSLPSTADIRRYVDAFIQFAYPHLPVSHIPTLNFDSHEYSTGLRSPTAQSGSGLGITGGGGCLILSMAAIGALYEYDHPSSKDLFDASKKMLSLYLEERRKADMSAAVNGGAESGHITPLWLVQTMLLNVVYGHQCGDKIAADIASNQCAALVSLARAANLNTPPHEDHSGALNGEMKAEASPENMDMSISHSSISPNDSASRHQSAETDLQTQWTTWRLEEERKRTLFAVFIISSLMTTAYNHTPTITNSEIGLNLPCEESLWRAETAQEWHNRGGLRAAEQTSVPFGVALRTLLTANQRHGHNNGAYGVPHGLDGPGDGLPESELRPSTFGCLVLINALHNYIWETRSRHCGRQWTPQETETMFSHIEPALNAWQAAWKANEHHKLERPNPFGLGPLAADSIPLLDLAFVRLFVNLGRSKECFWQRDFDGMAEELARGTEIVQHADSSPGDQGDNGPSKSNGRRPSQVQASEQSSSRRERHLRKAAFYAADSLSIACTYNLTYADMSAHELPIQSAMGFFDCVQVLAEWACTLQERVGRYLGVLGRDHIDFTQVPAIMLLETEDVELLRKIERICESLEAKRFQQENMLAMDLGNMNGAGNGAMLANANLGAKGYGSKILRIVGLMLEKAIVWPVTHVMAKALETQANHMDQRADASTVQ